MDSQDIASRNAALLADLTEPQVEAVTHKDGPLLVLAGPGSGKTRVITRRIAYLIREHDVAPWHVLAITFTNKAAGEMRHRVSELVTQRQADAAMVTTFHSFCARMLRFYGERIGLPPGFSIYDTSDQQRAVKRALELLDISSSNFSPATVLHTISNAKNELLDAEGYEKYAHDYYSKNVLKIFRKYESLLKQCNALDFDDLILKTVTMMREQPDILAELRERYQYVLIDEYQDTNHAQFVLANALASEHKNFCATGDPDQSIYGWRGANIGNILDFESHYPDAKVVRLEQNYRSTKNILAAADGLIANNTKRKHKALWTENETGQQVTVVACHDERAEAKWIVEQIQAYHDDLGLDWSDFAIFYRTNSLSRVMEDALRNATIPYQIARGTAFFDRKEIKDAVAYLRAIANPADEVNLMRIINTPARGISNNSVKAMQAHAVANEQDLDAIIKQPEQVNALNTRAVNSVNKFAAMLDNWRRDAGLSGDMLLGLDSSMSLKGFVEKVLTESGLLEHYRNDKSDIDGDRIDNLGELVSSAQQFEDDFLMDVDLETNEHREPSLCDKLLAYLEQIALISDVDAIQTTGGSVTLMTLHAAKGLEYPVVAIIGVEEGLLPHERSLEDRSLEEERRLCFVGITRAMRQLVLSHARHRTVFGSSSSTIPSRFLNELPPDVLEQKDVADETNPLRMRMGGSGRSPRQLIAERQTTAAAEKASEYPPGTLVRHPQFGVGRVITVTPSASHTRARIEFPNAGVKTIILQYTTLEKLD